VQRFSHGFGMPHDDGKSAGRRPDVRTRGCAGGVFGGSKNPVFGGGPENPENAKNGRFRAKKGQKSTILGKSGQKVFEK
jgi:hypothetical protein